MAVIILCGLARAGKDVAADYICKNYGFTKYTFSSVLETLLKKEGVEPSKENMNVLGDTLRFEMGMDAVAKILDETIEKKEKLILVGPRSMEEIDFFKIKYPKLKVIKIRSDKDNRFKRKSKSENQNRQTFFERDENDLEKKGLKKVLDSADYEIKNNENLEKFYNQIDLFMNFHSDLNK